ncbi:MAG: hypothetical protein JOZ62_20415 [Acidobacteriaceae bacterium]|nr:hypothetical protein [Acidobacteriaceae bacterium]
MPAQEPQEVNIKQAKNTLNRLAKRALEGERNFITIRSAKGIQRLQLVPVRDRNPLPGYGMFKGVLNLPPGWDSQAADDAADREGAKLFSGDEQ